MIDGEARLETARQLGLPEVPCILVAHLSEAERRSLRLALIRRYVAMTGDYAMHEETGQRFGATAAVARPLALDAPTARSITLRAVAVGISI